MLPSKNQSSCLLTYFYSNNVFPVFQSQQLSYRRKKRHVLSFNKLSPSKSRLICNIKSNYLVLILSLWHKITFNYKCATNVVYNVFDLSCLAICCSNAMLAWLVMRCQLDMSSRHVVRRG